MGSHELRSTHDIAANELRVVTAMIAHQMGFSHTSESSLDLLQDLTRKYIENMCRQVKWITDNCGRVRPTLGDVHMAYRKMGVSADDMNDWMRSVRPLPRFPAARSGAGCVRTRWAGAGSTLRPPHVPVWAPPISRFWLKDATSITPDPPQEPRELAAASCSREENGSRVPIIPDFSSFSAQSLGLLQLKQKRVNDAEYSNTFSGTKRSTPSFPPSQPCSRPPTRPSSRFETFDRDTPEETMGMSRPASSASICSSASQPMFKRRIKRKDEISSNFSSSSRLRLGDPVATSSPALPTKTSKLEPLHVVTGSVPLGRTGTGSGPLLPTPPPAESKTGIAYARSSANAIPLLAVATDFVSNPSGVVGDTLAGRTALPPLPALPPPLSPQTPDSHSLERCVLREDEQPNRIAQMAVLRSIFFPSTSVQDEMSKAMREMQGDRVNTPAPAADPVAYMIVKDETPLNTPSGGLKLKLSRRQTLETAVDTSSEQRSASASVMGEEDSDENEHREHRSKKRKKKRKREREREEDREDDSYTDKPSPCEVLSEGQGPIRLKIRLGPRDPGS